MAFILEGIIDESYEPAEEEVREYGEWLGMNLEEDHELLWIARAGLKVHLPPEWKPCQTEDGDIFYFNIQTQESEWEHPCDDHYRKMYQHQKARLNAPVRVVTISGCFTAEDILTVTCVGSLSGEEIGVFQLKPAIKVRAFRGGLAKKLEISKRRLRIFAPDGGILSQEDDQCLLSDVLDIEIPVSVREETISEEEGQLQQKTELKTEIDCFQGLRARSCRITRQAVEEKFQHQNPELPRTPDSQEKEPASTGLAMCKALLKPLPIGSLVILGSKRKLSSAMVKHAGDKCSEKAVQL